MSDKQEKCNIFLIMDIYTSLKEISTLNFPNFNIEKTMKRSADRLKKIGIQERDPDINEQNKY